MKNFFTEWKSIILSCLFLIFLGSFFYLASLGTATKLVNLANTVFFESRKIDPTQSPAMVALVQLLENFEKGSGWSAVLRHISLALWAAAALLLAVDIPLKRAAKREQEQERQQLYTDVFSALSGRMVPPGVTEEIQEILKSEVARENAEFVWTIKKIDSPPNKILLRLEERYDIRNLTGIEDFKFNLRSVITPDKGLIDIRVGKESFKVPRHVSLIVQGKEINLDGYSKDKDKLEVEFPLSLPAKSSVNVTIISEEHFDKQDGTFFTALYPIIKPTVRLLNEMPDIVRWKGIHFMHPRFKLGENLGDRSTTWPFSGVLLSGQGFYGLWEEVNQTNQNP